MVRVLLFIVPFMVVWKLENFLAWLQGLGKDIIAETVVGLKQLSAPFQKRDTSQCHFSALARCNNLCVAVCRNQQHITDAKVKYFLQQ